MRVFLVLTHCISVILMLRCLYLMYSVNYNTCLFAFNDAPFDLLN